MTGEQGRGTRDPCVDPFSKAHDWLCKDPHQSTGKSLHFRPRSSPLPLSLAYLSQRWVLCCKPSRASLPSYPGSGLQTQSSLSHLSAPAASLPPSARISLPYTLPSGTSLEHGPLSAGTCITAGCSLPAGLCTTTPSINGIPQLPPRSIATHLSHSSTTLPAWFFS